VAVRDDSLLNLDDIVDALLPRACIACDGPASSILCARCAETVSPAPAGVVAACAFGGAVADAVRAAKFRPDEAVAEALGRLWVARIEERSAATLPAVDGIAFVPAPYRRRLARGFDLPAVLACALAGFARVPVVDALACTRADAPLSFGADKAERAAKVAGRFHARGSFAAKHLLLVDDVRTTGATLAEASRVLGEAGAEVTTAAFAVAL
jgi:predicted amidophosphoribosyltransferase